MNQSFTWLLETAVTMDTLPPELAVAVAAGGQPVPEIAKWCLAIGADRWIGCNRIAPELLKLPDKGIHLLLAIGAALNGVPELVETVYIASGRCQFLAQVAYRLSEQRRKSLPKIRIARELNEELAELAEEWLAERPEQRGAGLVLESDYATALPLLARAMLIRDRCSRQGQSIPAFRQYYSAETIDLDMNNELCLVFEMLRAAAANNTAT